MIKSAEEFDLITIFGCEKKLNRGNIYFYVSMSQGKESDITYISPKEYKSKYAELIETARKLNSRVFQAGIEFDTLSPELQSEIIKIAKPKKGNSTMIFKKDLWELYSSLMVNYSHLSFNPNFEELILKPLPEDASLEIEAEVISEPNVKLTHKPKSELVQLNPDFLIQLIKQLLKIVVWFGLITGLSLVFGSMNNSLIEFVTNPFYPVIILISVFLIVFWGGGRNESI